MGLAPAGADLRKTFTIFDPTHHRCRKGKFGCGCRAVHHNRADGRRTPQRIAQAWPLARRARGLAAVQVPQPLGPLVVDRRLSLVVDRRIDPFTCVVGKQYRWWFLLVACSKRRRLIAWIRLATQITALRSTSRQKDWQSAPGGWVKFNLINAARSAVHFRRHRCSSSAWPSSSAATAPGCWLGPRQRRSRSSTRSTYSWVTIGTGYSPFGQRWQAVTLNGYLILNNAVDLPCWYIYGDAAVTPMYQLREVVWRGVGRIAEGVQRLLFHRRHQPTSSRNQLDAFAGQLRVHAELERP